MSMGDSALSRGPVVSVSGYALSKYSACQSVERKGNTWKLLCRSLWQSVRNKIDLVPQDVKNVSQIAMRYRLLATLLMMHCVVSHAVALSSGFCCD